MSSYGAHTVNLAWDASPDSSVVGYKIYYGANPSTLTASSSVDVGANLTASVTNLGSGTYYFAAAAYNSARAQSDLSNLASTNFIDPPIILSQSSNVTCPYGATTNLSVNATGSSLSYQWTSNGVAMANAGNVSGVTTANLTFTSAVDGNAGNYQVVVSNSAGTTTSSIMTLTVSDPPSVTSQPSSLTRNTGATATYSISATGAPALGYQWLKNGSAMFDGGNVLGSTSASLTLSSVSTSDAATYQCVVTNSYGSASSASATLTVIVPAAISSQPTSQTLNAGSMGIFNVTATGTGPLTYSWTKNGSPVANSAKIFGATTASLTVSNIATTDAGSYVALVSNSGGSASSSAATLAVIAPPVITSQPQSLTTNAGPSAVFSVTAQSSQPMNYQWIKNGSPIVNNTNLSGAATPTLTISSVQLADAGSYTCIVTNSVGATTSSLATLTVMGNVTITSQPTNQTVNACDTLALTVGVNSSTTPSYQWFHNNNSIAGATNSTFTIAGANGTDAGTYYVQVTGNNTVVSSNAVVTVHDPIFLEQPADNCVSVNGTNVFTVQACGAALTYQWYFIPPGSTAMTWIVGATNASLTVGPATSKNVGQYACVVTNDFGSITSRAASLGVEVPPTINSQPANVTTTAGASVTFSVTASANAPLTFQWARNNKNILDATNSSYAIAVVQTTDAGTYQCYVGTTLCQSTVLTSSSNGHLTVNKAKPNSKFTSPTSNTQFTTTSAENIGTPSGNSQQIMVSGVASDTGRVTDVSVSRTFPPSAPLTVHPTLVGSPTQANWTNFVSLVPGTNVFAAVVTDAAGLTATNTVTVFLRVPSVFHLSNVGAGTTTAMTPFTFGTPTNNAVLDIGRNYHISAKPAVGNVFSNWVDGTGAEVSASQTLVFRMQTNLQLTANFVTNPIIANRANGSYNGLFYETNEVRVKSAGAIFNLNVRPDAMFSGSLKVDGRTYLLTGTFDVHGNVSKHLLRLGKTALTIAMHLDFAAKQITGTISSPAPDEWTSVLLMDIAPYSAANRFTNSARYTLAIPPVDGASTNSPGGFGFGFVTNSTLGSISFVGNLADGTAISQTVPISQQGYWPLYIPLYGNRGVIEGWVNFSGGAPAGNISWIRPAGSLTTSYTSGFTNVVNIFGSPYTAHTPALTPVDNSLEVGLPVLTFPYAISNNNTVVAGSGGPTNYLSGSIAAPSGAVTLSYRPTGASANLTAHGAVLQGANVAYGYVISNNISASLKMH